MLRVRAHRASRIVLACLVAAATGGCRATNGSEPEARATAATTEPGAGGPAPETAWKTLGDIVYVLPRDLPPGWTVQTATERPGHPQGEGDDRIEVLSGPAGRGHLVLMLHRQVASAAEAAAAPDAGPREPGAVEDFDAENLYYLVYVLPADDFRAIVELPARGVAWRSEDLEFVVVHVAAEPDDELVSLVADELADADDLDFDMPSSATAAGFDPVVAERRSRTSPTTASAGRRGSSPGRTAPTRWKFRTRVRSCSSTWELASTVRPAPTCRMIRARPR